MRWFAWVILGFILAGMNLACDDKDTVPPDVIRAQQSEKEKRRQLAAAPKLPTTQELLSSKKKTLVVGSFPLTLEVPQDWNLKSGTENGSINIVGPASSGEVRIQLVEVGQSQKPEVALAQAKAEQAAKPHPINRLEMRDLGPLKVLEQRVITNAFVNGKPPPEVWTDADSLDSITGLKVGSQNLNLLLLKWNFTTFEKGEKEGYIVRSLNFVALSLPDYEKDREFLEQMTKTLKYQQ